MPRGGALLDAPWSTVMHSASRSGSQQSIDAGQRHFDALCLQSRQRVYHRAHRLLHNHASLHQFVGTSTII
jgi:hypothetical protein